MKLDPTNCCRKDQTEDRGSKRQPTKFTDAPSEGMKDHRNETCKSRAGTRKPRRGQVSSHSHRGLRCGDDHLQDREHRWTEDGKSQPAPDQKKHHVKDRQSLDPSLHGKIPGGRFLDESHVSRRRCGSGGGLGGSSCSPSAGVGLCSVGDNPALALEAPAAMLAIAHHGVSATGVLAVSPTFAVLWAARIHVVPECHCHSDGLRLSNDLPWACLRSNLGNHA